jgi:transposase
VIKSIQDIMRKDAGVDGDAQRIGQLVWMFFLKILDDQEESLMLLSGECRVRQHWCAPLDPRDRLECRITDNPFDNTVLVAELNEQGTKVVISRHPARALKIKIDAEVYKLRHLMENFFGNLEECTRIAMRALPDRPMLRGHGLFSDPPSSRVADSQKAEWFESDASNHSAFFYGSTDPNT